MKHELKIWPQYFERVADGSKTFELRRNDRGFQPGDTVVLKEYDPDHLYVNEPCGPYTGRKLTFRVGYVLPVNADYVVFSLLPEEPTGQEKR